MPDEDISVSSHSVILEEFVREDDRIVFGAGEPSSLHSLSDLVNIHVSNTFQNLSMLYSHLDDLNLLDPGHLRPQWDAYFMVRVILGIICCLLLTFPQTLASLASKRSNCMKRRVGAVLVRENRILATGYAPHAVLNSRAP
jgi:dCMP deaminase